YSHPPMRAAPRKWVVLLTVFLDLLGFGIIIPVAAYYATDYGASPKQIAWLTAAYSLTQFIFVPFWGRLSDRVGRRPVMIWSILGTAVSLTLFGWAPNLTWLFIARAVHGAMTANLATAQAYMADISPDNERAKAMGMLGAAFGVGFIVGPFLGGHLAELGKGMGLGYSLVGYGGAALSLVNFVLDWFLLVEPERHKDATRRSFAQVFELLRLPGVSLLVVAGFVSTFAFANMTSTYALLTMERLGWTAARGGERLNGYVFGLIGLIGAVLQGGLMGPLVRRFREPPMVIVGLFAMGGAMALLGAMHTVVTLLTASVCMAIGNSLSTPTLASLVSIRTPPEHQGSVLGATASLGSLGRLLGPVVAGLLYEYVSSGAPYFVAAVLMATAGLGVLWNERLVTATE
ncbi:MAG: MFS transporter, partial [Myxococcales bacterium]|nr:MFS transporter [Myxococcales bacterium]